MSNRFYVNGVQIFGNNEMFQHTYDELVRQGGKWTEDGVLPRMRNTAIKGCVVVMDDIRLVLKPRRVITTEMY